MFSHPTNLEMFSMQVSIPFGFYFGKQLNNLFEECLSKN